MRNDKRAPDEIRPITIRRNYLQNARGSALIEVGKTRVICSASIEEGVPPFLRGSNQGWITAEYGMLPCSSDKRIIRESTKGRVSGRTHEIQRLIGRSMRAVTNLTYLGEQTIFIDCDVIQADGGTRTASISGGFVALYDALRLIGGDTLIEAGLITDFVGAVSVGIVRDVPYVDLTYSEDSHADVDMNIIMTGSGKFVEIQGTAEKEPFSEAKMKSLLALAKKGIKEIIESQRKALQVHT
ncbi:MAG: ribonuclease PH [Gemmatimonadota bacterium]|nr:MAG: ribonuclease PH [Gemmatimonadota bacterium]